MTFSILVPTTITPAMVKAGSTIAEPDTSAGEVAWTAGGTYALGAERVSSGGVYAAVQASAGRTVLPAQDAAYWLLKRPSNRMAAFDSYISTASKSTGSITLVLQPGFFNGLSLYGLVGDTIAVTVRDAPGGAVVFSYTTDLFEQATGLYELLFTPLLVRDKLVLREIPISPTAELTITVNAAVGAAVAIGMVNVGDWRAIIGAATWGGTRYGVSSEPKTYSYIKFNEDGSTEIKRRGKATDMRGAVAMPAASADYAYNVVQQVLDVPVSIIATTLAGYDYLNVFGLISGSLSPDGATTASFNFSVKGFI